MAGAVSTTKLTVYIGTTTECDSVAEYDADTWTKIGNVLDVGEFGPQHQEITYTPVETGVVRRLKGALDNGSIPLTLARDPDDDGQADLIAARADFVNHNIKIELNDKPAPANSKPTRFFLPGKVMGYRVQVGDANQVLRATCTIGIDGDIVEGTRVTGT